MKAGARRAQPAIHRVLAAAPREPAKWLRPTFLVTRGVFYDGPRQIQLPPVYIAVLSVDPDAGTGTYEVLGSNASPVTIGLDALRTMLEQRGTKQ